MTPSLLLVNLLVSLLVAPAAAIGVALPQAAPVTPDGDLHCLLIPFWPGCPRE